MRPTHCSFRKSQSPQWSRAQISPTTRCASPQCSSPPNLLRHRIRTQRASGFHIMRPKTVTVCAFKKQRFTKHRAPWLLIISDLRRFHTYIRECIAQFSGVFRVALRPLKSNRCLELGRPTARLDRIQVEKRREETRRVQRAAREKDRRARAKQSKRDAKRREAQAKSRQTGSKGSKGTQNLFWKESRYLPTLRSIAWA